MYYSRKKTALTLIEILVVLSIMAVLMAVVTPRLFRQSKYMKVSSPNPYQIGVSNINEPFWHFYDVLYTEGKVLLNKLILQQLAFLPYLITLTFGLNKQTQYKKDKEEYSNSYSQFKREFLKEIASQSYYKNCLCQIRKKFCNKFPTFLSDSYHNFIILNLALLSNENFESVPTLLQKGQPLITQISERLHRFCDDNLICVI